MSNEKSLVKLVSTSFVGGVITKGAMFFLHLLIAWNLGADGLGVFAFGLVLLNGGTVVAKLGLDNAVQKYTPLYARQEEFTKVGGVVLFSLGGSFLFGLLVSATIFVVLRLATYYNLWTFNTAIYLILPGIPVMASMLVGMSATTGFLETKYRVFIDVGQKSSALLFTFIGLYITGTIESVIIVYLLSLVVGGVLALVYLYWLGAFEYTGIPNLQAKKHLTYSLPLMLSSVTMYLTTWTDVLMLGVFKPPTVVGQYQAAYQLTNILGFLTFAVNSIFPSVAADLYHHNEKRLNDIFISVTKWVTYFTLFGYLFFIFFPDEILLLFGDEFTRGRSALLVLGASTVIATAVGPVGYLLSMSEYEQLELINTATASVLNILLNYVLIIRFGLLGAAVATAMSITVLNLGRVIETWRLMGIRPVPINYWKGAIAIAGATVVMYLGSMYNGPRMITIGVTGVLSFSIFIATIVVLGFSSNDRLLLESLF